MIEWSKQIPGAADAELGIPRKSPITYHCTAKQDSAAGLIFIVHGFGDDANAAYDKILRRYIAETANLLVVTVEYHCYQARPSSGGLAQLPPESLERIGFWAAKLGIPFAATGDNIFPLIQELGRKAPHPIFLKGLLVPKNGDYQNFGVLQALDHITVLNDILDSGFAFNANRVCLIGSSHGGYIAHLIAKFAPNSILGLIDNSSYTVADTRFLGQGTEYTEVTGNIRLAYNVTTEWQFSSPANAKYFSPSRAIIRDTKCLAHMVAAGKAAGRTPQFLMYNTVDDEISPIEWKRKQLRNLQRAGFSASLKEITEADTGGDLFKSVKHADAPLQKLFAHAYGSIKDGKTELDRYRSTEVTFDCFDRIYTAAHSNTPPYFEMRVEENPDY